MHSFHLLRIFTYWIEALKSEDALGNAHRDSNKNTLNSTGNYGENSPTVGGHAHRLSRQT